jgi:V/A-type H+-transporting ATPase subunit E
MENTLERMVDRIYQEGISKAEDRARQIVAAAEARAEEITGKARGEAAEILRQAKAEADKLLRTAESDLRLLASRSLSQLKSEIGRLITAKAVAQPVATAASDVSFISEVITQLLRTGAGGSVSLLVPDALREQITQQLSARLVNALNGLEVRPGNMKSGFTVVQKDAGYELDFSEAALMEFLEPYLKPAVAALFSEKNG